MKFRTTLNKSLFVLDHKSGALIIGVVLSLFLVSTIYYSVEKSKELFEQFKLYENDFRQNLPPKYFEILEDSVGMLMFSFGHK